MIRLLGLIFCGAGFLSCVAMGITTLIIKDAYPIGPPEWLVIWMLVTGLVSVIGFFCVLLVCLGAE